MSDHALRNSLLLALIGATALAFSDYAKAPTRWDSQPRSHFYVHWGITVCAFTFFWLNSVSNKLIWKR